LVPSRQLINRGGGLFYYKGNIVPLEIGESMDYEHLISKINDLAGCLTLCFGLKGVNTVDFILNSEGVWVLEVNPRWSASVELIERYLGKSLFDEHLRACAGGGIASIFRGGSGGFGRSGLQCKICG
jgi:predicted ATP-grasp superfamily ATP-dependent carboligase